VVHYIFQYKSTKLSQDVIQYYKNITSLIDTSARIQRDTIMNSTKSAQSYKEKLERRVGGLKEKDS